MTVNTRRACDVCLREEPNANFAHDNRAADLSFYSTTFEMYDDLCADCYELLIVPLCDAIDGINSKARIAAARDK